MMKYIIPFFLVILSLSVTSLGVNEFWAYLLKIVLGVGAIVYFWKQYKEIKLKFDFWAWVWGLVIIIVWISLEFLNKGNTSGYDPTGFSGAVFYLAILQKIIGMVIVAAIIEELFMRSFLIRIFINTKFEKVKIGQFTWFSFIATSLVFGLLHGICPWAGFLGTMCPVGSRVIVGIISGAMFNLWLYYRKDIFSCIQCHASANLFLALYVLFTQNWLLW